MLRSEHKQVISEGLKNTNSGVTLNPDGRLNGDFRHNWFIDQKNGSLVLQQTTDKNPRAKTVATGSVHPATIAKFFKKHLANDLKVHAEA